MTGSVPRSVQFASTFGMGVVKALSIMLALFLGILTLHIATAASDKLWEAMFR